MDNENTNQETAEVEQRAAYIRSLVRPSVNGNKNGRKVWSIDLETFWVPFFTATTTSGDKVVSAEALGAPLRLAKDSDGSVKFSKSGKPVIKVVKEIADGVKLVRENMVANGMAYIKDVRQANPEGYKATVEAAQEAGARVHRGGTYVVMEGPLFSTRAESDLYRSWGASVIGMTALPEAKLAREAEICYATLACATDYDCWREGHESVTIEMVIANLTQNVATAKQILRKVIPNLPARRECGCAHALQNAIITRPDLIPPQVKKDLALLMGKYVR